MGREPLLRHILAEHVEHVLPLTRIVEEGVRSLYLVSR